MGHFKDYCGKLFGEYNNNIGLITKESTDRIFYLINNPNEEIYFAKKLSLGKFYLIKYDYNGNKMWCPIFIIDDRYKTDTQKRILYAINIDYLPYAYRVIFFDILFEQFRKTIDFNANKSENDIEKSLKVNFEFIFNLLKKNGGHEYAITAFDYSKIDGIKGGIPKTFFVSTTFLSRFIFINTKMVNMKSMKDLSIIMDDYNIKNKLNDLINEFNLIKEDLNINDQKEYYKKLKNMEQRYKLFKNK